MDLRDHLQHAAVAEYASKYLGKTLCRTSALSGAAWVEELVAGNQTRLLEQARTELDKFEELSALCRRRGLLKYMSGADVEEQLMIFLFIVGRHKATVLHRSASSISGIQ